MATTIDNRERCVAILQVINTDIKQLKSYPLDFTEEIKGLEKAKEKVQKKIASIDNIERMAKIATAKADMSLAVADDEMDTLGNMKGIRKRA